MESKSVKKYNNINSTVMKKLALTTGLFSLVMVLTSFNTSGISNDILVNNATVSVDPTTGAQTGNLGQKKVDVMTGQSLNTQSNFASVNQSIGMDKKVD
jgi:hypothetical protein